MSDSNILPPSDPPLHTPEKEEKEKTKTSITLPPEGEESQPKKSSEGAPRLSGGQPDPSKEGPAHGTPAEALRSSLAGSAGSRGSGGAAGRPASAGENRKSDIVPGAGDQRRTSSGGPERARDWKAEEDKRRRSSIFDPKLRSQEAKKSKDGATAGGKTVRRPKKIYDNSFRLQPHYPYSRDKVQIILLATLKEMFEDFVYQQEKSNDLSVKIAEKLRQRVLALKYDRYKLIIMVNIGPLNRQGLHIAFRCLWDGERDIYNIATVKSFNAFCTTVIYAVYFE